MVYKPFGYLSHQTGANRISTMTITTLTMAHPGMNMAGIIDRSIEESTIVLIGSLTMFLTGCYIGDRLIGHARNGMIVSHRLKRIRLVLIRCVRVIRAFLI